jgi:hypothetical protein
MIALLEGATTVDRDAYWVDVIAEVNLEGEIDGHAFQASFLPRLPFALDDHELYLRAGDSLDDAVSDPTRATTEGSVAYVGVEPATLTILGLGIPVAAARAASVASLLIAVAAGVGLGLPTYRARRGGQASRILAEYGPALVSLSSPPQAAPGQVVEVQTFDDLAHLAERTGRTIMYFAVYPEHHFYLRDGDALFHAVVIDPGPTPEG